MENIIFDPTILSGKPIIKGTRISVDFILGLLGNGMDTEEIIEEYPQLKKTDIAAALHYAAQSIQKEEVVLVP
jgi:uncharacterized protein (DUF433 family)